MHSLLGNNKGMVLIITYFVLVVLLGLSAVIFMRATNEARLARISNSAQQAFYEAEAGIAYAYYELSRQGFEWYTHNNKDSAAAFPRTEIPQGSNPGEVYIENNCYRIQGREFRLKTYPDPNVTGSGVVVVLSQATVDGISRTIEYRLGQESAYQYFFFFPKTYTFGTATYDGRNFGGIHVNGDIIFTGNPAFHFLTQLTCGWDSSIDGQDKGYIRRYLSYRFADAHGELNYPSSPASPLQLSSGVYKNINDHFSTGQTQFRFGEIGESGAIYDRTLPYYLDETQYSGADWEFDKYDGDGTNTTAAYYTIDNADLKNLAIYELCGHQGSVTLLSNQTVEITNPNIGIGTEREIFEKIVNFPGEDIGLWNGFWTQWKTNHENDYLDYDDAVLSQDNWLRRFYRAGYDWPDENDGVPNNVNMEWWQDLEFGTDRASLERNETSNDLAWAQVVNNYTGEDLDWYFLNTKYQGQGGEISAWGRWLDANNLDVEGEFQTLVQDITQSDGNNYLDPGRILDTEEYATHNELKQKALNGGIYIGQNPNFMPWVESHEDLINEIFSQYWPDFDRITEELRAAGMPHWKSTTLPSDCKEETQFYNAAHPAGYYGSSGQRYQPSKVLVVDVHALKEKIDSGSLVDINGNPISKDEFNGVVYIDLNGYEWQNILDYYDANSGGIMLVNGERLPDNGLSIVTPDNVFIKGNYNLDPDGVQEKNRDPDDPNVINRIVDPTRTYSHYGDIEGTYNLRLTTDPESEHDSDYLYWQPAEIITKRAVYTLSEDFPEPSYMPMSFYHWDQYNDQPYSQQNCVSGDAHYSTANDLWTPPTPAQTKAATPRTNTWFTYYRDEDGASVAVPSNWIRDVGGGEKWIDKYIPTNKYFALDAQAPFDGTPDTYYLGSDLRSDIYWHIESAYDNRYSYNAVHGSGGWGTANTPSQVNQVTQKHIYNTAVVTPYAVGTYVLENWGSTGRIINGAFIQLPGGSDPGSSPVDFNFANWIPKGARYYRVDAPTETFNYETRFGRGATVQDQPNIGLTFGADDSWREISSAEF